MLSNSVTHRQLLPLLLICLALPLRAGEITLDAPKAISALVTPYLPKEPGSQKKLQTMLEETLATEGYFSPTFKFSERDDNLQLKIDPGLRTSITGINITIDGPIEAKTRDALISDWQLPVGQPFRQQDWNTAKQQILSRLLSIENPAAQLLDSEAAIDTATHSAKLSAHYDAGPRYRVGELHISGLLNYSPDLIERYNRALPPGTLYREDKLNALISNLQATPYFTTVQGRLDMSATSAANADGTVTAPLDIQVTERALHRVAFGAGASSNTGARIEVNYQTPNLFNQAWEFNSGLRLEQKRQTAYGDIFLPPDTRDRRHSLGAMVEQTDIQGLQTSRFAFGAQSVQQRGSIEQRLSLSWQSETRTPEGALKTTSRALVPNVMWTWRKIDNLLDPHDGVVLQFQVGGGAKAALSSENFIRLHSRWQQYIPLGHADTLSLRGEIGYTVAESRDRIPQDFLFRTGGTGAVRGYTYQSLGVTEGSAVVGGRYLAVVSGEATHWLNDSWGVAAFVDAGDAVDNLSAAKLAVGYGLGARWRSPAGPLGVDLAYGQRTGDIHLHFSLAIPF
jgi:translocation and assembly module TamA